MRIRGYLALAAASIFALPVAGPTKAAGNASAGKQKFQSCAQCHRAQPNKRETTPEPVPKLGGQHAEYIVSALNGYAAGDRKHAGMTKIAATLSEKDKQDIAAFIAQFELKTLSIPETRTPTDLERKLENCRSCHGERGNSFTPYNPRLISQNRDYLLKSLQDYKKGLRQNPTMIYVVQQLDDRILSEMAAYYATQQGGLRHID